MTETEKWSDIGIDAAGKIVMKYTGESALGDLAKLCPSMPTILKLSTDVLLPVRGGRSCTGEGAF